MDGAFLSLEGLDNGLYLISNLGIAVDFGLQILKDSRIYHGVGC